MSGLRDRIRPNEGHARLWTVLGGIAAVVALPLSVVLALAATGDDSTEADSAGAGAPAATSASRPGGAAADGSATPDGTNTGGDAGPASGAPPTHEGQISLRSGSGADLEAAEVVEERTAGPNGDLDIHFDVAAGLRANGGNIFEDQGPQQEARSRCLLAVTEDRDGRPGAGIYGSGAQFCFRTSQGQIGWVRVNDRHGISTDQVVVLDFRVWPAG